MSTDDTFALDASVSGRFRQERLRLGLTHSETGRLSGYSRGSVISWEKGTTLPAAALGELARFGFDVQYICTGGRSENAGAVASSEPGEAPLSIDEWKLVKRYRALGEAQRSQALAMLDVLSSGVPITGTGNAVVVKGSGNRVAGRNYVEHLPAKPRPRTKG